MTSAPTEKDIVLASPQDLPPDSPNVESITHLPTLASLADGLSQINPQEDLQTTQLVPEQKLISGFIKSRQDPLQVATLLRKRREAPNLIADLNPIYSSLNKEVYTDPQAISKVETSLLKHPNKGVRHKMREFKKNYPWVFRIVVAMIVIGTITLLSVVFPPLAGIAPFLSPMMIM